MLIYDNARPRCPEKIKEILIRYLGRNPFFVVDLGCGTGLSTIIWSEVSNEVIGIEPSKDMIKLARDKSINLNNVNFISAFSNNTGLKNSSVDIITCSQSFHWMDPETTLNKVDRILRKDGIFVVYDCDWPPVCNLEAELEYNILFDKVKKIESGHKNIKDSFIKWDKENNLDNIGNSKKFRYVRELVF